MFTIRDHPNGFIGLAEEEERLYRLPSISPGRIASDALDARTTAGPHGRTDVHGAPTSQPRPELER